MHFLLHNFITLLLSQFNHTAPCHDDYIIDLSYIKLSVLHDLHHFCWPQYCLHACFFCRGISPTFQPIIRHGRSAKVLFNSTEDNWNFNISCTFQFQCLNILKGTVHHKIKILIFPLTCSADYQWFWHELPSFGDIGCRDSCLFSNIMGLNGAQC